LLSKVSETALITLNSRVAEARKANPVIVDPEGERLLAKLAIMLPGDLRARLIDRAMPASLSRHIALRARQYDSYARAFLRENPQGLVVNLGGGFDTRFWRLSAAPERFLEVDLPPVIELKRQLLGGDPPYRMIAGSVLERNWMEAVLEKRNQDILFLAEGLLMYLPKPDVTGLFRGLSGSFSRSFLVFETVHERYVRGVWHKMLEAKMKRSLGCGAGASFQFGIRDASEIEAYAPGIKVLEEWSYFEEEDLKPAVLRLFRHWKFVSRTQWTIRAAIG